jgi:hypothetical protein
MSISPLGEFEPLVLPAIFQHRERVFGLEVPAEILEDA